MLRVDEVVTDGVVTNEPPTTARSELDARELTSSDEGSGDPTKPSKAIGMLELVVGPKLADEAKVSLDVAETKSSTVVLEDCTLPVDVESSL